MERKAVNEPLYNYQQARAYMMCSFNGSLH